MTMHLFATAVPLASLLLPGVAAAAAAAAQLCHGKICDPVLEYCSVFLEGCDQCAKICDANSHNFHVDSCAKECADYNKYDPLKAEIHTIHTQQRLILILLVVLLVLIAVRYAYKFCRWLRHKRCTTFVLKKLQLKSKAAAQAHNGKEDLGGTTIQNVMTIQHEMGGRAPSQIYSVTGAEGSAMTMTTPVSTRYPAENSITPTTIAGEYSYDNRALAVTPVSEKPSGTQVF